MKNANKNLIFSGLLLLAILSLISPISAKAYYYENEYGSNFSGDSGAHLRTKLTYTPMPVFPEEINNTYTNTNSYNSANNSNYYNNSTNRNNSNNSTNQNTNTSENNTETTTENNTVSKTDTSTTAYKNLTANAIFGTRSFMPSGLIQWILLAIFILLIIIFVRRVTGSDEKYHNTPLKHA